MGLCGYGLLGEGTLREMHFKCVICGKLTAGRLSKGGDGTFYYPRKHKYDGKLCPGSFHEAEWIKKRIKE